MKLTGQSLAKVTGGLFMVAAMAMFAAAYFSQQTALTGVGAMCMGVGATWLARGGLGPKS